MTARIGVAVMATLLVLYLVVVVQFAVGFLLSGGIVPTIFGIALIVLPLLGFWALIAEIVFGFRSERLGYVMAREGTLPEDDFERLASGRPDPASVKPHVDMYVKAVEAAPDDWRAAYRLGLILDAAGERGLARQQIVRAVRLERAERGSAVDQGPVEAS